MATIDELVNRARELTSSRDAARSRVVRSIRATQAMVASAIAGSALRGMPNLMPDGEPFRAVRVRGHFSTALPFDGRPVLCLCDDGVLRMAMRSDDRTMRPRSTVVSWEASDDDIRAEDISHYVAVLGQVLTTHLAQGQASTDRYARLERMAERLSGLVAA